MSKHDPVPDGVASTITALRAQRQCLAAQLDAIDLALENLLRVWPERAVRKVSKPPKTRLVRRRRVAVNDSGAVERRDRIVAALKGSAVGLRGRELLKTAQCTGKELSNSLQILKAKGQIKRAGNAWVVAA